MLFLNRTLVECLNKNSLIVVAQITVAAVVLEGAVVSGFPAWGVIWLAGIMLEMFSHNARKDGHSGVPLMYLAFLFLFQSLLMIITKKIIAVVLETKPCVDLYFNVAAFIVVYADMVFDSFLRGPPVIVLAPLVVFWLAFMHNELEHGLLNIHFLLLTSLFCMHAIVMTHFSLVMETKYHLCRVRRTRRHVTASTNYNANNASPSLLPSNLLLPDSPIPPAVTLPSPNPLPIFMPAPLAVTSLPDMPSKTSASKQPPPPLPPSLRPSTTLTSRPPPPPTHPPKPSAKTSRLPPPPPYPPKPSAKTSRLPPPPPYPPKPSAKTSRLPPPPPPPRSPSANTSCPQLPPPPKPLLAMPRSTVFTPAPAPIPSPPPIPVVHKVVDKSELSDSKLQLTVTSDLIDSATRKSIRRAMHHVLGCPIDIRLKSVTTVKDSYNWAVGNSFDVALGQAICQTFRDATRRTVRCHAFSSSQSVCDSLTIALSKFFCRALLYLVGCPSNDSNFCTMKHPNSWSSGSAALLDNAISQAICRSIRNAKWHVVGCPFDISILRSITLPCLIHLPPATLSHLVHVPCLTLPKPLPSNSSVWPMPAPPGHASLPERPLIRTVPIIRCTELCPGNNLLSFFEFLRPECKCHLPINFDFSEVQQRQRYDQMLAARVTPPVKPSLIICPHPLPVKDSTTKQPPLQLPQKPSTPNRRPPPPPLPKLSVPTRSRLPPPPPPRTQSPVQSSCLPMPPPPPKRSTLQPPPPPPPPHLPKPASTANCPQPPPTLTTGNLESNDHVCTNSEVACRESLVGRGRDLVQNLCANQTFQAILEDPVARKGLMASGKAFLVKRQQHTKNQHIFAVTSPFPALSPTLPSMTSTLSPLLPPPPLPPPPPPQVQPSQFINVPPTPPHSITATSNQTQAISVHLPLLNESTTPPSHQSIRYSLINCLISMSLFSTMWHVVGHYFARWSSTHATVAVPTERESRVLRLCRFASAGVNKQNLITVAAFAAVKSAAVRGTPVMWMVAIEMALFFVKTKWDKGISGVRLFRRTALFGLEAFSMDFVKGLIFGIVLPGVGEVEVKIAAGMVEVPKLVSELDPPSLFMLSTMVLVALVMVVKKTNLMQLVVLCLLHFMLMTLSNHLHSVVMKTVSNFGHVVPQQSVLPTTCKPVDTDSANTDWAAVIPCIAVPTACQLQHRLHHPKSPSRLKYTNALSFR